MPVLAVQNSLQAVQSLPHRSFERAQLLIFAGMRDNGKTTALREYLEEREPRVLVLDPFEDFKSIRRRRRWTDALADMEAGGPCRRRVVPPLVETEAYAEEFFGACVERLRDCLLVLDEISLWTGVHPSPYLRALVQQGRRLGIRMAIACQRLEDVPSAVKAACTELVLFKVVKPEDVDRIAGWAGKDVAAICPELTVGRCVLVRL